MKSDEFKKALFAGVKAASKAAAPSNAANIRKISILPQDFSISTGELGPTLKLKRSVAIKLNAKTLEALYSAENKKVDVVDFVPTGGAASGETKTQDEPVVPVNETASAEAISSVSS